jgi:hypothetical protein
VPRAPAAPSSTRLAAAAATLRVERLLAAASEPDLWAMEQVRRRLVARETELERTRSSPRRTELDELVAADIQELCDGFRRLERAVDE